MKVADIMQHEVEVVSPQTTVREIANLIFVRNINGVPVVKNKKIVGFITERDILAAFYPTIAELIEDPVHSQDFDLIEKRSSEILKLPASKIMSTNISVIKATAPIMKAESQMLAKKVGRLPVVDENGNLIGVVSKGDIFRAAVGSQLPTGKEEQFYDWLAHHYDIIIDWKKRLKVEVPGLVEILRKHKARKILDVGSSTGEHSIALAKEGFDVVGIDTSRLIVRNAEKKLKSLVSSTREKVNFHAGNYSDVMLELSKDFDAAIFLGNALPYVIATDKKILEEVGRHLVNKSTIILQIVNINKLEKSKNGMANFVIRESHEAYEKEHASLGFYSKNDSDTLLFTQSIFDNDGHKWIFKGMNSVKIARISEKEVKSLLKKLGFKNIKTYGSSLYDPLFDKPFDSQKDNMLNIIAER